MIGKFMKNKAKWEGIDIISTCVKSQITLNFKPDKRFYRVRLSDGCGIFDMHTNSIVRTSDAIFSEHIEPQYRYAGNKIKGIEAIAAYCALPESLQRVWGPH